MTETKGVFDKFIFESAEQYLHTVVLIDDRIYESKSGSVAAPLAMPPTGQRKAALKSAAQASQRRSVAVEVSRDSQEPDEVSFHDVQNSFAKKRIICSLYQPKKDASFSPTSEVYSLCSSADVVIVDWDLHGNPGVKATELIVNLIVQSRKEVPHQLRLILIYTLDLNLGSVANVIYEGLTLRTGEQSIDIEDGSEGLILTTDNSRVVVLGKRPNTSLPQYSGFFVPEKELAQRATHEFSRLASGLLQAIVLRGIANLRKNNRRILMRFHEGLDAAFLAHRALLLPEEPFGQIIPLLTDEIRAVLEDNLGECPLGTGPAVERIITEWCNSHWKPGEGAQSYVGDGVDPHTFAKDVFCKGRSIKEGYSEHRKGKIPKLVASIKEIDGHLIWSNVQRCIDLASYLVAGSQGDSCHELLGSLMSQRITYGDARRALRLGVVIQEISGQKRYLLCLQPVCDSLRMKGKTQVFVFCCLDVPKDGQRTTHTVLDLKNNTIQLQYKPKALNCFVSHFTASADAVFAKEETKERFVFKDDNKNQYEWIAELKTEHAQRAAEEFGRMLSRVGLTESEWLRLKAK